MEEWMVITPLGASISGFRDQNSALTWLEDAISVAPGAFNGAFVEYRDAGTEEAVPEVHPDTLRLETLAKSLNDLYGADELWFWTLEQDGVSPANLRAYIDGLNEND